MTLSSTLADSGKIFIGFIWDFLYFPIWWYSRGLWGVLKWAGGFLIRRLRSGGLLVWLKNLFTPMFGQKDIAGKLISFVVRLFQIGFRSIVMAFWLIYAIVAVILWITLPIYLIYQLIFQLGFIL